MFTYTAIYLAEEGKWAVCKQYENKEVEIIQSFGFFDTYDEVAFFVDSLNDIKDGCILYD
jgi:hypothetical protein